MGVLQSINTTRESIANAAPEAEVLKASALNACRSAIQTCKGSGSITTELSKIKDTCVDLPVNVAASALKGSLELCTAHPVKAVCTVAKGATKAATDTVKLMTSPVPVANAAVQSSLRTAGAGLKTAANAPFTIYRKGDELFTRVTDTLFAPDVAAPANDNNAPALAASNDATPTAA